MVEMEGGCDFNYELDKMLDVWSDEDDGHLVVFAGLSSAAAAASLRRGEQKRLCMNPFWQDSQISKVLEWGNMKHKGAHKWFCHYFRMEPA